MHTTAFLRTARAAVRVGAVLCLAAAAVVLAAESGEYQSWSRAGIRVLAVEVLPLVLVPWLHLATIVDGDSHRGFAGHRAWPMVAFAADVALFAQWLPGLRRGAPPASLAVPVIATLLALGTLGVIWARADRDQQP